MKYFGKDFGHRRISALPASSRLEYHCKCENQAGNDRIKEITCRFILVVFRFIENIGQNIFSRNVNLAFCLENHLDDCLVTNCAVEYLVIVWQFLCSIGKDTIVNLQAPGLSWSDSIVSGQNSVRGTPPFSTHPQ